MSLRMTLEKDWPQTEDFMAAFLRAKNKGNVPEELEPEILAIVSEIREWTKHLHPGYEGAPCNETMVLQKLRPLREKANELLEDCLEKPLVQSL